jgi:hypothetical protein
MHNFGGAGQRPAVTRSSVRPPHQAAVPALFTNDAAALTAIPGDGPVWVDVDMDFFCNHFDDSTPEPPPLWSAAEVADRIEALGRWLRRALVGRRVGLVTMAVSPGFYPAALWQETLPLARRMCRSLSGPGSEHSGARA